MLVPEPLTWEPLVFAAHKDDSRLLKEVNCVTRRARARRRAARSLATVGGLMAVPHLRFDVLTIFPAMVSAPIEESIVKRAVEAGLLTVRVHNIRDFALDKHHSTDDTPYGGGAGMVMRPGPVFARGGARDRRGPGRPAECDDDSSIVLLTPQGRPFTQSHRGGAGRTAPHRAGLRPLRGLRRAGSRAPRHRRDLDRRLRAHRAASCRRWSCSTRSPGWCPACSTPSRWPRSRSRRGCSNTRTTRARRTSGAGRCRRCCSRATTPRSRAGAGSSRCFGRCAAGRTCWHGRS